MRFILLHLTTLNFIIADFLAFDSSCFDKTSCRECLESSCDWSEAGCLSSCDMIADVACYSSQYFENMSTDEVCEISDKNKADSDLCGSQKDCSSCTGSVLSDGIKTCQWFSEGFCASGCNMIGCGETTCPSDNEDTVVEITDSTGGNIFLTNNECKDDETFLHKNKQGKDCTWLGQKKEKRKNKLCKNAKVLQSCPESCGACEECPSNLASSVFNQSCSKYKDGLTCSYNYIFTGCDWNSLQCHSKQVHTCNESTWSQISFEPSPCENPPKDLPFYEECEPCPKVEPSDKCPSIKPGMDSKCSEVGLSCKYDFIYTGCNLEQLRCTPITHYSCTEENQWIVAMADKIPCP